MENRFKRLDVPLSFRVPHKLHERYKKLSGFGRKDIQYTFVRWLRQKLISLEEFEEVN